MAIIAAWAVGPVLLPLVVGVLPWAVSLLAPHDGWTDNNPGVWNIFGLLPVLAGCAVILWCWRLHLASYPARVELALASNYLLTRGPYQFSRNPMYVATFALWLGWTLFYGSIPVLLFSVLWAVVYSLVVVPREERALEARFGDVYLQYKGEVPRWIWKIRL
jgi:protein-S-isoprenylcysteine O-methyltransferase Ste14